MKKLSIALLVVAAAVGPHGQRGSREERENHGGGHAGVRPAAGHEVVAAWERRTARRSSPPSRRPDMTAAVVNAEGDAAEAALSGGPVHQRTVRRSILMTSLDTGSWFAISAVATARKARRSTTTGQIIGCKGATTTCRSTEPDGRQASMGRGVKTAMTAKGLLSGGNKPVIAYLNGGPTDNNSKLFKQGNASVLDPLIKSGKATKGPDTGRAPVGRPEGTHDLRADARADVQQDPRRRRGQRRARGAVVTALKAKRLKPIPLSGQDATAQGVQNIISGWQTGTVLQVRARSRRTRRPP